MHIVIVMEHRLLHMQFVGISIQQRLQSRGASRVMVRRSILSQERLVQ
jgi:hypothetical protein